MKRAPRHEPPRTSRSSWRYFLFIALFFLGMILYVWERVEVAQLSRDIDQLRSEEESLRNETDHLRVEIATLSARERIERIARKQLGMVYPINRPLILSVQSPRGSLPPARRGKLSLKAQLGFSETSSTK